MGNEKIIKEVHSKIDRASSTAEAAQKALQGAHLEAPFRKETEEIIKRDLAYVKNLKESLEKNNSKLTNDALNKMLEHLTTVIKREEGAIKKIQKLPLKTTLVDDLQKGMVNRSDENKSVKRLVTSRQQAVPPAPVNPLAAIPQNYNQHWQSRSLEEEKAQDSEDFIESRAAYDAAQQTQTIPPHVENLSPVPPPPPPSRVYPPEAPKFNAELHYPTHEIFSYTDLTKPRSKPVSEGINNETQPKLEEAKTAEPVFKTQRDTSLVPSSIVPENVIPPVRPSSSRAAAPQPPKEPDFLKKSVSFVFDPSSSTSESSERQVKSVVSPPPGLEKIRPRSIIGPPPWLSVEPKFATKTSKLEQTGLPKVEELESVSTNVAHTGSPKVEEVKRMPIDSDQTNDNERTVKTQTIKVRAGSTTSEAEPVASKKTDMKGVGALLATMVGSTLSKIGKKLTTKTTKSNEPVVPSTVEQQDQNAVSKPATPVNKPGNAKVKNKLTTLQQQGAPIPVTVQRSRDAAAAQVSSNTINKPSTPKLPGAIKVAAIPSGAAAVLRPVSAAEQRNTTAATSSDVTKNAPSSDAPISQTPSIAATPNAKNFARQEETQQHPQAAASTAEKPIPRITAIAAKPPDIRNELNNDDNAFITRQPKLSARAAAAAKQEKPVRRHRFTISPEVWYKATAGFSNFRKEKNNAVQNDSMPAAAEGTNSSRTRSKMPEQRQTNPVVATHTHISEAYREASIDICAVNNATNTDINIVNLVKKDFEARSETLSYRERLEDGTPYLFVDIDSAPNEVEVRTKVGANSDEDLHFVTYKNVTGKAHICTVEYEDVYNGTIGALRGAKLAQDETRKKFKITEPHVTNAEEAGRYLDAVMDHCIDSWERATKRKYDTNTFTHQQDFIDQILKKYDIKVYKPSNNFIQYINEYLDSDDSAPGSAETYKKEIFKTYLRALDEPSLGRKPPRTPARKGNAGMALTKQNKPSFFSRIRKNNNNVNDRRSRMRKPEDWL